MTTEIASTPRSPSPAPLRRAIDHLASVQWDDGRWEGEVAWNSMLLAQYVIVRRIVADATTFDEATRRRMIRYFEVTRTPEGGFGLHPDSGPYVYFTAMAYVALRLLGVGPDEPICAGARRWLQSHPDGVVAIPSWGKFWLSLIGLYEYDGVNPIVPELFLLPESAPLHPNHYYCHTRYIYLGIAWLYGRRFRADLGPITEELRRELYPVPYSTIDFAAHRHSIARTDLYVRPSAALRLGYDALHALEKVRPAAIRRRALDHCLGRVRYELRASRYQCVSPVNGLLNCLALFANDPGDPELAFALQGVEAWKWDDEATGIRYAGARSSAWDTAFALHAGAEAWASAPAAEPLRKAYGFLRRTQLREELEGREAEARDPIVGGWCFSDGEHRWPVSDCTAEAISALLLANDIPNLIRPWERISFEQIRDAARFILSRRNDDGGFGTYERRRGGALLEALNPSEMFGNCMTELSYLECTASSVAALARIRARHPDLFRAEMDEAIAAGTRFLRAAQRGDGSWPGFWGVNFTYAIFHVVSALRAVGAAADDPAIERAADWLVARQKSDGGWGEHYLGCLDDRYLEHPRSQVIMTSWAVLALLDAAPTPARAKAIERGVALLRARQQDDGSWPKEGVAGVFFGTAMLDYLLYKDYFPAWALARHAAR